MRGLFRAQYAEAINESTAPLVYAVSGDMPLVFVPTGMQVETNATPGGALDCCEHKAVVAFAVRAKTLLIARAAGLGASTEALLDNATSTPRAGALHAVRCRFVRDLRNPLGALVRSLFSL